MDARVSQHSATIDKPYVVEKVTYKPAAHDNKDLRSQLDPRHSRIETLGHPLVRASRPSIADGLSEKKKLFDPRQPPAIGRYLEERRLEAARLRGEREMASFLNKWEDEWKEY